MLLYRIQLHYWFWPLFWLACSLFSCPLPLICSRYEWIWVVSIRGFLQDFFFHWSCLVYFFSVLILALKSLVCVISVVFFHWWIWWSKCPCISFTFLFCSLGVNRILLCLYILVCGLVGSNVFLVHRRCRLGHLLWYVWLFPQILGWLRLLFGRF